MKIDLSVSSPVSTSMRVRQLEAMFDIPPSRESKLRWRGTVPLTDRSWQIGLIVGPSGSGKTLVARELFGADRVDIPLSWNALAVVEDFGNALSMDAIASACQAVGFNTIPAWLRPYAVLSRGEQFRVELARRLLELGDPVVVDEFSSVVDRQVAQIAAHAVQKWVRRHPGRQFVAVSCHEDVLDWLQPDWVLEPAGMRFAWRSLQPRPELPIAMARLPHAAWRRFAPFHYLTANLHVAARCFGLWCNGTLAAFTATLYRTHPIARDIQGLTRTVCLPDWQGLGLAPRLTDTVGAAYKAFGWRLHAYPAHPHFIRVRDRSPHWAIVRTPDKIKNTARASSTEWKPKADGSYGGLSGGRPCAVYRYVGPALPRDEAARLLGGPIPAPASVTRPRPRSRSHRSRPTPRRTPDVSGWSRRTVPRAPVRS